MARTHTLVGLVLLVLTLGGGQCSQLDVAIPQPGTIIGNFANDSLRFDLFCRLLSPDRSRQILTTWFFLSAEGRAQGRIPGSVIPDDQRFSLSGNDIMSGTLSLSSGANLTVNGFTTGLHNSTLSCGTSEDDSIAAFTIYVYVRPSIPENFDILVGDLSVTVTWQTPTNLGNPEVSYYSLVVIDDRGNSHTEEILPASQLVFTASGLLPLTNYTVELAAISLFSPELVSSPTVSLNFSTNTSVPLVNCTAASIALDQTSVRIEWENIHTGGQAITTASVGYTVLNEDTDSGNFTLVDSPGLDISSGLAVLGTLPQAGLDYIFRVSAENEEGESLPSLCPPIFLVIGAPSTPDVPDATADGPLATVRLRTANSGNGDSVLPFAFTVLVHIFNTTDNSSRLVSEEERFNSSQYTSNESITINVEDVVELNQFYSFAARAVNMFGESETSALSEPILLNVSVPAVSGVETTQGPDAIAVSWTFLHTGGSDVQLVEVLLRENRDGASFELVPGGNISRPLDDLFLIEGRHLRAGAGYEVAVRVTNEQGKSELITSQIQESAIGVPAVPLVPTLFSSTSDSITLILSTSANGLLRPDDTLTFRLRITATDDDATGNSMTSFETGSFSAEVSRGSVRLTVPASMDTSYIFSVRAENRFGSSEYSGDSESISLPKPTEGGGEGADELQMREVIGISVGVGIVVLLLLVCCAVLICALCARGGKEGLKMEGEGETGMEMQDNSLYQGHKRNKSKEKKEEFPPEAYEAQYEPPPNENHGVPLRPKPTHPTEPPTDQAPPLYDTLNPTGRQVSTYSSTSSRELPNPLYSGTRPISLHDSGSGIIHSRGAGEEPLYSEARGPPAVYTEPDSQASKLLESFSAPPPPPPDPRTIPTVSPPPGTDPLVGGPDDDPKEAPTYAEAGPAGSEEHLYSELPDPSRRLGNASSPSYPPPHFNIPPPPPTQPPPSSSSFPLLPGEPSYSVPTRPSSQPHS